MEVQYKGKTYTIEKQECNENKYVVQREETSYKLTEEEMGRFIKVANKNEHVVESKKEVELVSFYNDLIQFNPFQYKPYLNLISDENKENCIYIADEVGAGKTFETGILISELLYSKRINLTDSILIICPNMLCRKWQDVLHRFYGLGSTIVRNLENIGNISIVSYDTISKASEAEIEQISNLKLLILDEAHNASGERFKKLLNIRKKSEYTVLLSATPLAGKTNNKASQVELLFGRPISEFSFAEESCYFNRSLKDEMRNEEVKSIIHNKVIENKALEAFIKVSKEIYSKKNTLKKYVGLNMIMSSPAAAQQYHDHLSKLTEDQIQKLLMGSLIDKELLAEMGLEESNLDELDMQDGDLEELGITSEKIDEIKKSIEEIAENNENDTKLEALKQIISENKEKYASGIPGAKFYKKIVVFTNYKATAEYLNEKIGIENSIVIQGTNNEQEKWNRFNKFKDENSNLDILIITNVACEGQDMDFCNTIVNYDLTYNPVQLAQRKGRVDRFEKYEGKDEIFIYNFMIAGVDPSDDEIAHFINNNSEEIMKYSNSIYPILLRKLRSINEETGIYYRVIDNLGVSSETINVAKARENTLNIFKGYFLNNELNTFDSISKLHEQYYKKSIEKVNLFLQLKNIEISKKSEGKIDILVDSYNKDFFKYVYDGGTVNSHLINNR